MRGAWLLLILPVILPATAWSASVRSVRVASEISPPTRLAESAVRRVIDEASCTGEYADALLVLSQEARQFERQPEANYSYCLRNTATYECLSYGSDGRVRRRAIQVVAHGTAFAYRERAGDFLLLTNDHVATWPAVTDDEHDVADVPNGCKKIDEQLRLVRDESDDYEPGQIVVQKVVSDPALDAAVLKTRQQLNVMPYRVGRSALLKAGNVVQIRGYPLGKLQATNQGKVVSAYDADREKGWNHTDFVTDALVTKGNSGSPVFAVSCRTGAFELVGLYHAAYKGSPALNVVVGVDQLRDLMDNLRRSKAVAEEQKPLGPEAHEAVVRALRDPQVTPFFKVGERLARVRFGEDGRLLYEIFNESFPARDQLSVVLEQVETAEGPKMEALSADPGGGKLRRVALGAADAEAQDLARDLLNLAQRQFLATLAYRQAAAESGTSREAFRKASELLRQLSARKAEASELLRSASGIAERLPAPPVTPLAASPSAVLPKNIADIANHIETPAPAVPPVLAPASGTAPPVQPQR